MFHENEDKLMKALGICSGGSSCWHMIAPSVRVKRSDSHVRLLFWLQILLVILLAGKASCQTSAVPTPALPIPTTTVQTSVQYFIDVTVDITGQKDESDIKAWLVNVFQNMLGSCVSPGSATSSNNTTTATTSVTLSNSTTTATSTVESNNMTTATTSIPSSNQTTTATTSVTLSNNTTTATSVTLSNSTTATSTVESNNMTTATTSIPSSNQTTTATTSVTLSNNTTATTSVTLSNSTTTATSTVESNNMTTATTSIPSSNQTTTATTPIPLSNNTTTVTTTLESNNTTSIFTTLSNKTTIATTTSALESNKTTTATTTTASESNKTTTATTTTATTTTASESNKTTTDTTTTATTTTASESNKTTTATTTTATTTSASESNKTTTATTSTLLESSKTTTATTPTTLGNNTTTAATTSAFKKNNTTTATTSTTLESSKTNTAPTSKANTAATSRSTTSSTDQSTTAATTSNNKSPGSSPTTTAITQTTKNDSTSLSNGNRIGRSLRSLRLVRDTGSNVTQSSGISKDTTTDLFQNIVISCATNTSIIHTECSVTLALTQSVPACCILRTLCAASNTSSDISVLGKKVYKEPTPSDCDSNSLKETSCTYTGPANKSCSEMSGAAYVAGQTNCGSVNNTCNCSSYCSNTDAYYTFQISTQNPGLNSIYVSSLISQKLKEVENCTPTATVSCPLSIVAFEYKDASMTCGTQVTNGQNCSVILHFFNEVPICSVAAAMAVTFQSQDQISFDGFVTRAAICGNSNISNSSPTLQFTQMNLMPANFCMAIQASNSLICHSGEEVVVQLAEQCGQMLVTTPSPNVTTIQPNTTAANVTVTTTNSTSSVTPSINTATNESAESQANALLDLTRDVSKLNSSQVDQLVSQLESLLSGPNVSLALGNISVNIVSNLLGASPETLAHSSNRIIGIVDTVGLKLVLGSTAETLLSSAVALSVKPADGSNFQETFFSISDPSGVQVRGIPRLGRSVTTDSSIPQGSVTLPSSLTQDLTPEQQHLATRLQFNFYQKSTVFQDKSLGQRRLNSGILGASVANLSITGLRDNVVIYLKNTEPIPANFVATCVFWDFTLNNRSGGWNPNGCVVQNSTDNETICGCNHLTSFAILLDLSRQSIISPLQNTILTFITYIGCGISAIFLSVTLLTYLAFEKLRKDIPSKILIQLCFALLLLNLVFLVDAWLALYPDAVGLCISTAWFLHYFLLVSFTWMGLEAVHMYNALVKVFNNHISCYMLKFSLAGWGIPMIVVIIVIAIDKNNYGLVSYGKFTDGRSDDFCWLENDIAFYVAVVAYFCVIFLFNLIMFIVVLVQLSRIKRQNPHNTRHRSTVDDVRSVAGITVLLGLTWGFAFFAWGPLNLAFMYLFAICNSLQGLFIFVFYCATKENVRRQWRTYLCCGTMRLAENSEWSRTATQKTVKKSSLNKLKSSQSNSSSSSTSFLVTDSSEQISGISSPFEDRVITADEDSRMDVILNEINSQYRNQQAP